MTEPNGFYDNSARQLLVSDVDLSTLAISIQVELTENGIPMCNLIADNEDAKSYLSKLNVGDTVQVKGLANSTEGYQIENSINWSVVLPCFVGIIQEITPDINNAGQVSGVMALGLGFQLKTMNVNSWYGDITALPQIANVVEFTDAEKDWSTGGYNQVPYIGCYSGESAWTGIYRYENQNYIQRDAVSSGAPAIGGFTFALNEDYDYNPFAYCKLHIVAGIYSNSSGQSITSATVQPFYSLDGGVTWTAFPLTDGKANRGGSITDYPSTSSFPPIETNVSNPTNSYLIDWLIPIGWTYDDTYNPLADYVHGPPQGEDNYIDITAAMNAVGGFNHNLQIKLELVGYSGTLYAGSGVTAIYMYLEYEFNIFEGLTARQLLAGDNITKGIIPNYINKVFNGIKDSQGNLINTGFAPIGTDYIVADDDTIILNLIPSLTLPYNDGFQAVNDVLRYASGLKLLQGLNSYHWRLDTLGNLLVAPVDNHSVNGVDSGHVVDSVPNTIQWKLRPYPTPIVVKQSMISQNFKQSVPQANMILINGRYQFPTVSTDMCQGYKIDSWYNYWVDETGAFHANGNQPEVISNEPQISGNCLKFPVGSSPAADYTNVWCYPLPSDLDLTKLMGRDTTARITALLKVSGGIVGAQIRLYWQAPNTELPIPDTSQFMYYDISQIVNKDSFVVIDINVPNTKFIKDFNGWSMGQDLGYFNGVFNAKHSTTHTIYDIGSVKFIALVIFSGLNTGLFGPIFAEMSDLEITGSVIRGVYDPNNVSGPFTFPTQGYGIKTTYTDGLGLRVLTIKNSLLYTDTLDPTKLDNYLGLECIYELQRNEIPYTTGTITIPFDPIWLDGQWVWVQAEDVIPLVGSSQLVQSHAGNPTTSTVGGVGTYDVNTLTWEVFMCTAIIGVPPNLSYIWVDQGYTRYKINQWFRILKVVHNFSGRGALTSLTLTNDMYTSFPINTLDSYTTIIRATSPQFQTHTNASLFTGNDFDLGLQPIITPFSPTF